MSDPRSPRPVRPLSAVDQFPAFVGLASALSMLMLLRMTGVSNDISALTLMMAAYALPNLIYEYRRLPDDAPAQAPVLAATRLARVGTKLAGLTATLAVIAVGYAILPLYHDGLLGPLLGVLNRIGLPMLLLAPIYLYVTDTRMAAPEDGCYMAGLCATGRWRAADPGMVWQFVLGWLVKAFFLPLMISFAKNDVTWALTFDPAVALTSKYAWFEASYRFMFFIDVFVACSGYLLTLKLFDIHIRSTEPTLAGWMVALICYPPFWNMAERSFLHYEDNYYWGEWLEPWPVLKFFWALAILCCVTIYVWATVSFGVRFSNLTNRGILTNGPYGLLMHPAYVSKNLSWWLISVPFVVTGSLADALTNCLLLAGINLIYFARAKTEERHLLRDPAYQAYALWMRAYGPGARLRRAMGLTAGLAGVR